tara:strand:+ start:4241 stop:4774 length:534 start_codon:yes stop_codon:yes gene_type:complete
MTKTLIQKGFNFWDENKRTLKIIGISFVVIFSIKSIGDSIYEKGFYCIEDTLEKYHGGHIYEDESEKRYHYREVKLTCLEKIHGRGYSNRKSKEYKEKYIQLNDSLKSGKPFEGSYPLSYETFEKQTLYYLWAAFKFEEDEFPEYSHFDLAEFKKYLRGDRRPHYFEELERSLNSLP